MEVAVGAAARQVLRASRVPWRRRPAVGDVHGGTRAIKGSWLRVRRSLQHRQRLSRRATGMRGVLVSRAIVAWIAAEGRAPRRDPLGIGWLGFAGVVLDDVTGFEGVRVLRQCAGSSSTRRASTPSGRPCTLRTGTPSCSRPMRRLTSRGETSRPSYRDLVMAVGPVLADLTGGKDSRVILAAMLSAGVADRFRFSTAGPPDLPRRTHRRPARRHVRPHRDSPFRCRRRRRSGGVCAEVRTSSAPTAGSASERRACARCGASSR